MPVEPPPATLSSDMLATTRTAHLPYLRVVRVSGADAFTFLQGQLTQDVGIVGPSRAALAAYCSAKGRILASAVIFHAGAADNDLYLMVHTSLMDALLKRLRMFVLRAKVVLEPTEFNVYGVWSDEPVPTRPQSVWESTRIDQTVWIAAPQAQTSLPQQRWWCIGSAPSGSEHDNDQLSNQWQADDIAAGLPWIHAPTQDLLTPLMANFDLIGGVSFIKGCYPGQEVVARSYYRSKPKRRLARGAVTLDATVTDASLLPGVDVYDANAAGEPVGRIINAATTGNGTHVLFEAPIALLEDAQLRVGATDGPAIQVQPLPYALLPGSDDASVKP